jgi:hypothetical protein
MLDYPYATDYGIHLDAWPVNNTCTVLANELAASRADVVVGGIDGVGVDGVSDNAVRLVSA